MRLLSSYARRGAPGLRQAGRRPGTAVEAVPPSSSALSSRRTLILQSYETQFFFGKEGSSDSVLDNAPAGASAAATQRRRRLQGAASVQELLAALQGTTERVDPASAAAAMLRLADWSSSGSAAASSTWQAEEQRAQLREAAALLSPMAAACMPEFQLPLTANLLWGLATVQQALPGTACDQQLLQAATQWLRARTTTQLPTGATADLVSILWGFAALQGSAQGPAQQDPQRAASPAADANAVLDGLCTVLAERMAADSAALGPEDLADCIWAVAQYMRSCSHRSAAVARLVEAVAHSVHVTIANRYSATANFMPADLLKVLTSFAALDYAEGPVPRMLDAVAGYIVKRILAKHLHCVSQPADIAAVLTAYVRLRHDSVAIPELVAACAKQLSMEVASSLLDGQHSAGMMDSSSAADEEPDFATPSTVASILGSCQQLGYYPGQALIVSLLIALHQNLHRCPAGELASILTSLAAFRYHPGADVMRQLLEALEAQQEACNARQLAAAVSACAALNAAPSASFVARAVDQCLVEDCQGLGASDIAGLLNALLVFDALSIQRFGLLCVTLREQPPRDVLPQHLLSVAQAALMLGEEGREMADEVLQPQMVKAAEKEWRAYVAGGLGCCPHNSGVSTQATALLATELQHSVSCCSIEVSGAFSESTVQLELNAMSRESGGDVAVVVCPLQEVAVNNSSWLLGQAAVRERLLRHLGFAAVHQLSEAAWQELRQDAQRVEYLRRMLV